MEGVSYSTRRADASDAEAIAEAHRDSIVSIGSRFYPPEVIADWRAGLTGNLYLAAMEAGEVFFIATAAMPDEPAVLGFASHRIDRATHRTAVYVRGLAARRGIGTALFRLAEEHAVADGATSIDVAASLAAVAFYLSNGFATIAQGEHRLRSGRPMACVYMRKTVGVVSSAHVEVGSRGSG